MKRTFLLFVLIVLIGSLSGYTQKNNAASPKKPAGETVAKPGNKASAATNNKIGSDQQTTLTPQPVMQKPKLSKEDSLKRIHRIDSIRKILAEKRKQDGSLKLSKEDSLKRVHKIDSLRKAARDRRQAANDGPMPYKPRMSKEDSLKRVHKMDSLRKAAQDRKVNLPPTPTPPKKEEKK